MRQGHDGGNYREWSLNGTSKTKAWCHAPLVVLLLWLGLLPCAHAHLMPARQGSVHLVGNLAYVVLALPLSAFPGADNNGDGLIDIDEMQRNSASMRQRIQEGLQLQNILGAQQNLAQWKEMLLLLPSQEKTGDNYFLAMGVAEFEAAPDQFSLGGELLNSAFAGSDTLKITATCSRPGHADVTDVGLLSQSYSSFTFFAPASEVVLRFAEWGLEHIAEGADHIVFLIALLAGGIAVRRWAVLLSTFTVAHGVTFALTCGGWIGAPAQLVEPLIALSIVGVAALNLAGVRMRLGHEAALVMVVGLVHGLGFASAMGGRGLSAMHPVWSVLGFNAGVEAGQALIALALFAATTGIQRWLGASNARRFGGALSVLSFAMGSYWLVDRALGV